MTPLSNAPSNAKHRHQAVTRSTGANRQRETPAPTRDANP